MYNSKQIQAFIEKVNEEAQEAAQAVFDKYEPEFKQRVTNQLGIGTELCLSMGSSFYKDRCFYGENPPTDGMDKFSTVVADIQYLKQRAGFQTYQFKKPSNT